MRLLIDTNRYGDAVGHDLATSARLQQADEVWLSVITVGELLAGFAHGSRRTANEACLRQFLEFQGIGVLEPDLETARRYAQVSLDLRKAGTPIPTNDIWIAAQALQHNLSLDSSEAHFRHIPGLKFA